ncbi:MAG: carboxypeptidase-like regulatory domain-containing protein [Gemmataceae bacterium]
MRYFLLVGMFLGWVASGGCSPPSARVWGTVTLNGQPVEAAELSFLLEGSNQTVHGKSGADGRFWLDYPSGSGMPAGKYRILVSRYTLPNGKPLPSGEKGEALRANEERVRKWTVRYEKELPAGNNTLDLEWNQGQPHQEP